MNGAFVAPLKEPPVLHVRAWRDYSCSGHGCRATYLG